MVDRLHPAGGRHRWAIGATLGLALASFAGVGGATAATDHTRPVVHAPIVSLRIGGGVGANAPVRIDVLTTDTGSGVPSGYGSSIGISRNGGPYSSITWGSGLFTGAGTPYDPPGTGNKWISLYRTFQLSGTYRVRARARDLAGNWSPWVYGPTLRARMIQENSSIFTYSSGWTRVAGPWLGGYAESAGTAGATVTGTFTASSIAWVARRAPGYGLAEVSIDGGAPTTVILNNSNPWVTGRLLVFSKVWTHPGTHSISIKVLGTGPVEFDGLLDIR